MSAMPATDPLTQPHPRLLSLGCGRDVRVGWVNLDIAPLPGVDVVHDLNVIPMPFEDNSFDYIECIDILEHMREMPEVMGEIHRILAPGGRVHIEGPHFTSVNWVTDPTHRRAFGISTFEFFTKRSFLNRGYYFDFAFAVVDKRQIRFQRVLSQPWNWLVEALVNKDPRLQRYYEHTFLARLFPAQRVEVILIK